ncbi:sterol desaturase family protein [Mycobacterium marinum]|uniref:sterol desaturase family protein n=1 Tax=Mycobacterium marinum TaxID=1781 RepID=UPI000B96172E|nr:sterol desaturase family protein [Mycobacterium marinum]MDC8993562.1 sterol desaturase family protein [Mycobacterium marinum]MDC9014847.1 sterol desaturase family protein [Mycobacterium marinum]WDZ12642.1 sterol desaturase family protein [Mycobacterium marinum]
MERAVPIFLTGFMVLVGLDFLSYRLGKQRNRSRPSVSARDTAANLSVYALARLTRSVGSVTAVPLVLIASALTPIHLPTAQWWTWACALVLTDLAYYGRHRMTHRIRVFWAAHHVHHSSQYLNLSTGMRTPWLVPGWLFISAVVYVPLALIGFPVWMIFACHAIVLFYQFPIHTERINRLPRPIEYLFNTPSHHRVHHGANNPYLNKNYGGILIVWDRLFGSYAEEDEPVQYGLQQNIATHNPIKLNYHEFVAMLSDVGRAKTWRGRVGYLLRPPGWSEVAETPAPRSHDSDDHAVPLDGQHWAAAGNG